MQGRNRVREITIEDPSDMNIEIYKNFSTRKRN